MNHGRRSAGVAVLALVIGALAGCGAAPTPTSMSTPCPVFGSTEPASGAPGLAPPTSVARLRNVQVQGSACVDEVAFLFAGGVPGWSVAFDGPLAARLAVRLEPASGSEHRAGVDRAVYDGPSVLTPAAPSDVHEVREVFDTGTVASWAIDLPYRRPFEVVTRDEQLVIRVPAVRHRPTRCAVPGTDLSVGYPPEWFAELGDRWACRYFDPAPFVVHPATDDFRWSVTVQLADAPADVVLDRMLRASGAVVTRPTQVGGLPATVLDVVESGEGLLPAGFRRRAYVVRTSGRAVLILGAAAPPGPGVVLHRRAVDRIAEQVRTD